MSGPRGASDPDSSIDRFPDRPAPEAAPGADRVDDATRHQPRSMKADKSEHLDLKRQEVGDAATSAKHPPHLTANDVEASSGKDSPAPAGAPLLPANASGKDKGSKAEQGESIDEGSMYDRRPERDKDRPPSQRPT